jgi:orotidine-5'-phosphate decarboxylase
MDGTAPAQQMRARFGWLGPAPGGRRPALILLSGLPGTGKSHLAAQIASRHPVLVVRSDEVRKALFRQPTYSSDESGAVYLTGYALLESLLRDGYAVVFDATNLLKDGRRRARAVATGAGAPCLTIVTVAPPEVVAARLARRASGGAESFSSDAGWTVYERLAGSADPPSEEEPLMVDTSRDIAPALAAVDRFLAGSASATGRQEGASEAFNGRLDAAMIGRDSLLCVGLDPEPEKLPEALRRLPPAEAVLAFNREIIAATSDLVVAYKPNLAFYEALGPAGLEALRETVRLVPSGVLTVGDAKRGDIANTMRLYAKALFEVYGFDAVTASPYLGRDALAPFLDYANRGVFVLCRTSNPGAAEIVELDVAGRPLYRRVAERAREWNEKGNLGLVVGATVPHELAMVREDCPSLPILLPGIGAQGGDLSQAVAAGLNGAGTGLLVVAARQVLYASSGSEFPAAARQVALSLREQINQVRRARQRAPRP